MMAEKLVTGPLSHEILLEEIEPPVLTHQVSSYENLIQQLSSMGFDSQRIEAAVTYTGAQNIEDIWPCLIKGERGWEHDFIPKDPLTDLCEICNEKKIEHISHQEEIISDVQVKMEEVKERHELFATHWSRNYHEVSGEVCGICFERIRNEWKHPECELHIFCEDCIKMYLKTKINDSQVLKILCPGENCKNLFTDEMIQAITDPDLFEKYKKFKWRAELLLDPQIKWCPTPNCDGFMKGSSKKPRLICPICSYELCFKCGNAWHGKKTCEEIVDEGYETWAKGKEIQLCPKCKHRIEKIEGCNHMSCSICSYQWCWLCRGAYSAYHFRSMNPFGCPNLQAGSNTREDWPLWKIYLNRAKNLGIWILIIIFFPLILLLLPAAEATRSQNRNLRDRGVSLCCRIFILFFLFIGVVLITPLGVALAIPVLLVYGIYIGIRAIWRKLKSR
ncbi:unnamed protein product [Blepharisma stoltei]|uniref:RBR-type E3 ubiquitin transferase n=1 Tax=Blepharisma stoltei TaxID=1481888 RepID=A0AAU9IL76_9CILI|nr:unnamed protein product [Blepharisma stoltei]